MKLKTIRAVEPNQGVVKKFEKKLTALQTAHQRFILDEICTALINSSLIVHDAKPSDESKISKFLSAGAIGAFISRFVRNNLVRWGRLLINKSKNLINWFVKNTAKSTANAQVQALASAGVSPIKVRQKFGIPTVNRQYLSPTAIKVLPKRIEEITNLVNKISADEVAKLQDVLVTGLESGQSLKQIRETLASFKSFDARQIANIARDQAAKVNSEVQRANALDLGITRAVWKHVPGRYTSRQTHLAMDKKVFDIEKGLYDEAVGRFVKPGELKNCRCIMRLIFDDE